MTTTTDLAKKRCVSCEIGAAPLVPEQVQGLLPSVPDWELSPDRKRIRREWRVRDFMAALEFFQRIAEIAEKEDHHPDLHLVGYRNATIEIWTHAVAGLTENDFILAAKIDRVPVALKK
jgi:4a-hydroxytetrahydrobiopterin dehydratase